MLSSKRSKIIAGILLCLASLLLVSQFGSASLLLTHSTKITGTQFFFSRILYWICLAIMIWYTTRIEHQPLRYWKEKQIGLTDSIIAVVVIFLILFGGLIILNKLLSALGLNTKSAELPQLANIFRHNYILLIFSAGTAGIVEELIFRGYLLPRFEILLGHPHLAIIMSAALFGAMHYGYGTLYNMIGPFFIGLVFGYYYWIYRNIKVIIICHFLWDWLILYLMTAIHH